MLHVVTSTSVHKQSLQTKLRAIFLIFNPWPTSGHLAKDVIFSLSVHVPIDEKLAPITNAMPSDGHTCDPPMLVNHHDMKLSLMPHRLVHVLDDNLLNAAWHALHICNCNVSRKHPFLDGNGATRSKNLIPNRQPRPLIELMVWANVKWMPCL